MTRHLLAGGVLALGASALVLLSGFLGAEVQGVALLGAALGGALGLVPDRSPGLRAGAFAVGFAAAWLGYLLRAVALPDARIGRAIAVLVVVLVCLAVAAASAGRLPLWATLLGAAAMAGAYETAYTANPTAFLTTSPAQATAVLVAAGLGFLATAVLATALQPRLAEAVADDVEAAPAPARTAQSLRSHQPEPQAAFRPFDAAPEA